MPCPTENIIIQKQKNQNTEHEKQKMIIDIIILPYTRVPYCTVPVYLLPSPFIHHTPHIPTFYLFPSHDKSFFVFSFERLFDHSIRSLSLHNFSTIALASSGAWASASACFINTSLKGSHSVRLTCSKRAKILSQINSVGYPGYFDRAASSPPLAA